MMQWPTRKSLRAIGAAVCVAVRDEEDKRTAEFHQRCVEERAAAKVRQAATAWAS